MAGEPLATLHAPLIPILGHALALEPPAHGVVLDIGCGPGLKAPLLAESCGPVARLLGIDLDRNAVRAAQINPAILADRPWSFVVGDALALPLRDGSCARTLCIGALGLFADRQAALREMRRVSRPGAAVIILTATQVWARVTRWPPALQARLVWAYARSLAEERAPLLAAPSDIGGELTALLEQAGLVEAHTRAFLIEALTPPPSFDPSTALRAGYAQDGPLPLRRERGSRRPTETPSPPFGAELCLLPWGSLRSFVAGRLSALDLAQAERAAAVAEVELCALALLGRARAP